jgi:hypothetical protein
MMNHPSDVISSTISNLTRVAYEILHLERYRNGEERREKSGNAPFQ